MDRTIELMAGTESAPAETPAGGTVSTDFGEQLILLGNRLTAIETALNRLSKLIEPEQDSPENTAEPEQDSPDDNTAEPEQDSPDDNTEAEPETPAESEE